ncbi:MAG: glycine cleavage system protein GcvH [Phycisphaerae bacterium]|nr:glycine cleavage system protein GcvH [Phycisphaerae bacterium]
MSVPQDRRYQASHEWHKLDGGEVIIGITQFAADELTDITYVSLPSIGKEIVAGTPFGEIESVKATSDLISGVSGQVVAVNETLNNSPELVNSDPFGQGWMIRVRPTDPTQLDALLTAEQYQRQSAAH